MIFLLLRLPGEVDIPHEAISSVSNISARIPQTAAVPPILTTALPFVCESEPKLADIALNSSGARPLALRGDCYWIEGGGDRCARR